MGQTLTLLDRQELLYCYSDIITDHDPLVLRDNWFVQGQCDMGEAFHSAVDY